MDKIERRAQILARARDVFAKRGYHAAKIEDIVAAAKVARGTLARWLCEERVGDMEALKSFDADGWSFAAPGIVLAEPPHDWLEAARAAETLALSLLVRSRSAVQSGPVVRTSQIAVMGTSMPASLACRWISSMYAASVLAAYSFSALWAMTDPPRVSWCRAMTGLMRPSHSR